MPFFLIPFALGLSFFLIWGLIGGMVFHDAQLEFDAGIAFGHFRQFATSG